MALSDAPAVRHRQVAGRFTELVRGVSDWSAPAPVDSWTARDVVDHLTDWFPVFLRAGGIELGVAPDDEPLIAWQRQTEAVQALFDVPARDFTHPYIGTTPLIEAIDRFYTADVFMHSWDLARATGQNDSLDEDYCADLLTGLRSMDEVLRASGQYGPAVPVPDDAPVQDWLVGFIGRDPSWWPPVSPG